METDRSEAPPALARIRPELVHELDVRADLRRGGEPFNRIMAARRELSPEGALRLRAIFEPVPLYAVMAKHGFQHWTERLADDDWIVWFYPADAGDSPADGAPATPEGPDGTRADPAPAPIAGTTGIEGGDAGPVILDVRGLEPPEPMVRTLAALEELPPGGTLLQINERVPQFLLPKLEELGFSHEVRHQGDDVVRVFIRRIADR